MPLRLSSTAFAALSTSGLGSVGADGFGSPLDAEVRLRATEHEVDDHAHRLVVRLAAGSLSCESDRLAIAVDVVTSRCVCVTVAAASCNAGARLWDGVAIDGECYGWHPGMMHSASSFPAMPRIHSRYNATRVCPLSSPARLRTSLPTFAV
jgi:hypothetical protein